MDTKNLVIFGAGVIAGYLLVDYLRKNPMGTTPNPIPVPPVISTNEATCQASLDEYLQSVKMKPENLEAYKKEYMDDCLKVEGTPCTIVVGGVVGIMPGVYKNGVCVNPNSTPNGGGGVIGGGVGNPTGDYGYEYYGGVKAKCPKGLIPCEFQPLGGAFKCYDPNANYDKNPCA